MSDGTVEIRIVASDGTQSVWKAIQSGAQGAGQAITQAGAQGSTGLSKLSQSATQSASALQKTASSATAASADVAKIGAGANTAAAGMEKLSSSSTKSATGFSNLKAQGAAAGATLAALTGFLSDSARAAATSEEAQARLEASVNASGAAYDDYATRLQAASQAALKLKFDDEDAQNALSTLTQTTGDAARALELLGVAEDLARGKGISLATASAIVGKVAAGNLGILSRYGIVLQEGATATEALASISQRFAGQAQAYAQTTQGALEGAANSFENFQERVGGALGSVAPALETVVGLLPGVSVGFSAAGAAAGVAATGIGKIAGAGKTAGAALAATEVGAAALGVALSPIGLVAAGLAVTFGALALSNHNDEEAAKAHAAAYKDLLTALNAVDDVASRSTLKDAAIDQESIVATDRLGDGLNELDVSYDKLIQTRRDYLLSQGKTIEADQVAGQMARDYMLTAQQVPQVNDDIGKSAQAAGTDIQQVAADIGVMVAAHKAGTLSGDALSGSMDNMRQILEYQGPGWETVRKDALATFGAWTEGRISGDELNTMFASQARNMDANGEKAVQYQAFIGQVNDELTKQVGVAAQNATSMQEMGAASVKAAQDQQFLGKVGHSAFDQMNVAGDDYNAMMEAAHKRTEEQAQAAAQLTATFTSQLVPGLDGASAAFADLVQPGEDVLDVLSRLSSSGAISGGPLLQMADGLNDSKQALDSVLQTFQEIDTLGQSSAGAAKIAADLVGDPGVYTTVDDLLNQGVISRKEYNQAVNAGYSIQQADLQVQTDLNKMRADGLPIVAGYEQAYADNIHQISLLTPAQQQLALAMQDSGEQAKLAALYSTAYAAASGQMGENGEEAATKIINAALAADPALKAMAENVGLVGEADGTVHINFPDADTVQGAVHDLTESVDTLITTLGGIPPTHIDVTADDHATPTLSGVQHGIEGINQTPGTATLGANDNATPTLSSVQHGVEGINTTTATAHVDADDQATPKIGPIQGALDTLSGMLALPKIDADDQATPKVETATTGVNSFDGAAAVASLQANDQATEPALRARSAVDQFDGATGTGSLSADDAATAAIAAASQQLDTFDGRTATAYVDVQPKYSGDGGGGLLDAYQQSAEAQSATITIKTVADTTALDAVTSQVQALDGKTASVGVSVSATGATEQVGTITGQIQALDGKTASVGVQVSATGAVDQIGTITGQIQALDGKTASVGVSVSATGAVDQIGTITGQIQGLDGKTATVSLSLSISGANEMNGAISTLNDMQKIQDVSVSLSLSISGANEINGAISTLNDMQKIQDVSVSLSLSISGANEMNGAISTLNDMQKVQDVSVSITATNDAGPEIANAMQQAQAFADQTYQTSLTATNDAGPAIASAMSQATAFARLPAQIHLTATNDAGQAIASAMAQATAFARLPAQIHLTATNDAGQAIASAMGQATAFARMSAQISLTARNDAGREIASAMGQASAFAKMSASISLTARNDAGREIASAMGQASAFAKMDATISLTANNDAGGGIAAAMGQVSAFAGMAAAVSLTAINNAGPGVAAAMGQAQAYVNTPYAASLTAINNAGGEIAAAMQQANAYAAGSYVASLTAANNAGPEIAAAMGQANAYASGAYAASLTAVDNASGTISAVQGSLAALDGSTATVTINAVDNTGGVGKQLGGAIQVPILHAASGRVVQVGEAGPENVTLPYGSMVTPTGASKSANQGSAGTADAKAAGQKAGAAFGEGAKNGVTSQKDQVSAAAAAVGKATFDKLASEIKPELGYQLGSDWAHSVTLSLMSETPKTMAAAEYLANRLIATANGALDRAQAKLKGVQTELRTAHALAGETAQAFTDDPSRATMHDDVQARKQVDQLEKLRNKQALNAVEARQDDARQQVQEDQHALHKKHLTDEERATLEDGIKANQARVKQLDDLEAAQRKLNNAQSAGAKEIAQYKIDAIKKNLDELSSRQKVNAQQLADDFGRASDKAAAATDKAAQKMTSDFQKTADKAGTAATNISDSMSTSMDSVASSADTAASSVTDSLTSMTDAAAGSTTDAASAIDSSLTDMSSTAADAGTKTGDNLSTGIDKGATDATSAVTDLRTAIDSFIHAQMSAAVGVNLDDAAYQAGEAKIEATDGDVIATQIVEVKTRDRTKSGKQLGGGIWPERLHGGAIWADRPRSLDELVPTAANGRGVWVGEAGPELAFLPYGTQVVPHGASVSADRASGGGRGDIIINGPVSFIVPDADVMGAIQRQARTTRRV